jgi:MFS transporter, OFA family, oxalate/formate antiporter
VERFGPRAMVTAGALLVAGGLLLASRATSLWELYAAYWGGVGVGIGLIYLPATEASQHWFVKRRGEASAFVSSGISLANLLGPPVAGALLGVLDWRVVYVVLAVAVVALGLSAAALLSDRPEDRGLYPDNAAAPPDEPPPPARADSARQILATRAFWLQFLNTLIVSFVIFTPLSQLAPYAEEQGSSPFAASVLLGLMGVGGLVTRLGLSGLLDRWDRRYSVAGSCLLAAVAMAWWIVARTNVTMAGFALLFGLAFSLYATSTPPLATDYFGRRHAGAAIGLITMARAPGGLIGPIAAGLVYDALGTYVPVMLGSIVLALAAMVCILLLRPLPAPTGRPSSV